MPSGYEIMPGHWFEDGVDLSGGQWQRIALSRASMRGAPLLVLDEPTSAMDAQSESDAIEQILSGSDGRTVLFISHGFNTMRLADRILAIENGRLLEQGSHDELVPLHGQYSQLYSLQAQGSHDPAGRWCPAADVRCGGRREAAGWRVGADASYLGAHRSPHVAELLAQVRGVRETVRVRQLRVDPTSATSGSRYGIASLVGIDGAHLRAAAPHSPAARALDAAGLTGPRSGTDSGTDIRVLATGARAGDLLTITSHGRKLRLRVVGILPDGVLQDAALGPVRGTTPPRERLLLADNHDLTAIGASDFEGSSLLLYGPRLDVQTLRSLVPRANHDTAVGELRIRSEEQADAAADGMISVLRAAYTACTALAVLLALLALVLELLLSAPARGRTTAYLRTLGLGGRATSALHLLQLLPMVLAAVAGGTALGLTLPVLLGPALDLREFTGGPAAPTPHPDLLLTAALGAGLGLLVVAAVGVETWMGRRHGLGTVLRLGRNDD